jgi:aminopeptidase N
MGAATAGSDLQLAWARCLIASADAPKSLDRIAGLLDGTTTVEGLQVDTDLRWQIVGRLAAAGRADESRITEELNRDPTDIGRRRAAGCLAARPTAEAKADVWSHLMNETGTPLATMNALMGGFSQPGCEELLRPYVDRYVEALPGVWANRTVDEALDLTEGLYPRYIVDASVVAAADRALGDDRLPGPAKRILAENRDGTLRAERARAADSTAG